MSPVRGDLTSERLGKAWAREHGRFAQAYNERLLNGLVRGWPASCQLSLVGVMARHGAPVPLWMPPSLSWQVLLSLGVILAFRFVVRLQLGESAGWLAFVFLQVYPRTFLASEATMFDSPWWRWLVGAWEAVVWNPVLDLERAGLPLAVAGAAATLTRRWWQPALRRRLMRRQRGARAAKIAVDERDLDV